MIDVSTVLIPRDKLMEGEDLTLFLDHNSWCSNDGNVPRIGIDSLKIGEISSEKSLHVREINATSQDDKPNAAAVLLSLVVPGTHTMDRAATISCSFLTALTADNREKLRAALYDYKKGKADGKAPLIALGKANTFQEFKLDNKPAQIMETEGLIFSPTFPKLFDFDIRPSDVVANVGSKLEYVTLTLCGLMLDKTCTEAGIKVVSEYSTSKGVFQIRSHT